MRITHGEPHLLDLPAIQTVFGEAPADARLVFVREQPGDIKACRHHGRLVPRQAGERRVKRAAIEALILELLAARGPGKTICPSEAARAIDADHFDAWMPRVRDAAAHLVARERIDVTQRGRVVDLAAARGPIRLRLR